MEALFVISEVPLCDVNEALVRKRIFQGTSVDMHRQARWNIYAYTVPNTFELKWLQLWPETGLFVPRTLVWKCIFQGTSVNMRRQVLLPLPYRCQANLEHIRQSRPDSGLRPDSCLDLSHFHSESV
jgi:hypothetical protein